MQPTQANFPSYREDCKKDVPYQLLLEEISNEKISAKSFEILQTNIQEAKKSLKEAHRLSYKKINWHGHLWSLIPNANHWDSKESFASRINNIFFIKKYSKNINRIDTINFNNKETFIKPFFTLGADIYSELKIRKREVNWIRIEKCLLTLDALHYQNIRPQIEGLKSLIKKLSYYTQFSSN